MVLVDTPVWIDWLRGGRRPASRLLARLIDEEDLAIAPIVLRDDADFAQIAGVEPRLTLLPIA